MRSITIGFSRPKNLMLKPGACLIMAYQGYTPFSHVYIKIYSNYTGETLVYQASHGLVNCMNHENFIQDAKIIKEFEYDISDNALKNTLKLAQQLLGRPYGYLGLIKLLLARTLRRIGMKETWAEDMDDFFCSQFVSTLVPELTAKVGLPSMDIQPSDLYNVLLKSGIYG